MTTSPLRNDETSCHYECETHTYHVYNKQSDKLCYATLLLTAEAHERFLDHFFPVTRTIEFPGAMVKKLPNGWYKIKPKKGAGANYVRAVIYTVNKFFLTRVEQPCQVTRHVIVQAPEQRLSSAQRPPKPRLTADLSRFAAKFNSRHGH